MASVVTTVGALVSDPHGRVLLVRTWKWGGRWGLPGGKIEPGEPMLAALAREMHEETGLAIAAPRFVLAQDCIDDPEFHRPAHMVLLNFTCDSPGGPVALNDEADEARWVTPAEARALPLNRVTRTLLDHVS